MLGWKEGCYYVGWYKLDKFFSKSLVWAGATLLLLPKADHSYVLVCVCSFKGAEVYSHVLQPALLLVVVVTELPPFAVSLKSSNDSIDYSGYLDSCFLDVFLEAESVLGSLITGATPAALSTYTMALEEVPFFGGPSILTLPFDSSTLPFFLLDTP